MTASAVQTYIGSFAQPGVTGNQSITGVGFTPKVVLFWSSGCTADGAAADAVSMRGVGISSSDRCTTMGIAKDQSSGNNISSITSYATRCIRFVAADATPTVQATADFVSQDGDGFTINWLTADATARVINFLAIGGADLTNVKSGSIIITTSLGNQSYTGVGFKPDGVIFVGSCANTGADTDGAGFNVGVGAAYLISPSARGSTTSRLSPFNNPSQSSGYQRTTTVAVALASVSGVQNEGDFVSMDNDGFTINWTTLPGANVGQFYVAFKGIQMATGAITQPAATGNQATTGIGFKPCALLLFSDNNAASSSVITPGSMSWGAGVSATQRFSEWMSTQNSSASAFSKRDLDRTKIIELETVGSTPTLNAEADLVSLDTDGWTLNWSSADATARQVLWFAIGPNQQTSAPSSDITDGNWLNASASNVNLYQSIDEPGPIGIDDTDYIQSGANPQSDLVEVGLSAITTPLVSAGLYLDYRTRLDAVVTGSGAMSLVTEVRQASGALSTPVTDTIAPASTTETTNTVTWSAAQIASILDGSTLTLRATATQAQGAAPTFVAAGTFAATATNGATITPGLPAGTNGQDILLLCIQRNDNTAATAITNWTNIAALTSNDGVAQRVEVWWRVAAGASGSATSTTAPAITFGSSTVVRSGRMFAFRGCDTTTPFVLSSFKTNVSGNTCATTDIAPTITNTLGFFAAMAVGLRSAATTPSGWAAPVIGSTSLGNDATIAHTTQTFAASGSYGAPSTTWTSTTTGVTEGVLFAIQPPVNNSKARITWAQLRVPTPLRLPFTRMQYLSHLGQPN